MKHLRIFLLFVGLGVGLAQAGIADHIDRTKIDGIDVIVLKTGVKDVVTIKGMLPVGNAAAPADNPALARLTAGMLDKGTTEHDKFEIARQLENVGAQLSFGIGNETLAINGKCLAKDVPLVISLIAEQLRSPAFDPAEFVKVKKQTIGALKRALDDTDDRAADAFSRAAYPLGHPNRQPTNEDLLAAVEKTTVEEVKAFHDEYYGPALLTLILVGDVDATVAEKEVTTAFSGWTGGKEPDLPATVGGPVDTAREQVVFMPDKTNVSVVWGQATGLRYRDPDALALRVATDALGGGMTARLMNTVRNRDGLTYGIYAYMSGDSFRDGDWRIWANFAPQNLAKGIASTRAEIEKWYANGISAAELAARKGDLTGSYKVGLSTTNGMAGAIQAAVQRGYDLKQLDDYPTKVEALTLDEVNGAIKRHLDPARMVIVEAGTVPDAAVK